MPKRNLHALTDGGHLLTQQRYEAREIEMLGSAWGIFLEGSDYMLLFCEAEERAKVVADALTAFQPRESFYAPPPPSSPWPERLLYETGWVIEDGSFPGYQCVECKKPATLRTRTFLRSQYVGQDVTTSYGGGRYFCEEHRWVAQSLEEQGKDGAKDRTFLRTTRQTE
jgi:hypothetical protein